MFWGRKVSSPGFPNFNIIFEGGRDTSKDAGIDIQHARGRISYVFDANGDGLLDIFVYQVG